MTASGRSPALSIQTDGPATSSATDGAARAESRDGRLDELADLRREVAALRAQLDAAAHRMQDLTARAHEDDLTGLLNRRGLYAEIASVIAFTERYRQPSTMLYLDLDRFKAINDQHGHAVGDAVLVGVARRLSDHLRRSDVLGRIGGDEFVMVLRQADLACGQTKADTIRDLLERDPITVDGLSLTVGGSIGVAEILASDTVDLVVTRADQAMYAVKRTRKAALRKAPEPTDSL